MDYYKILEIEKTATEIEIKKAYRKLAMKYHPDRAPSDKKLEYEEKFKQINEAYSVLSDSEKRKQYDMFGSVWWNWGFSGWWFSWVDIDLWDIFEQFFWQANSRRKNYTNIVWEDILYNLNIDLKTSIYWWKKTISINRYEKCETCNWIWGEWKKTCNKCNWSWYITYTRQSLFGVIQQTWTCDQCNWTWEIFEKICKTCNWQKRVLQKRNIDIDIPAWIDSWVKIKIEQEWHHAIWNAPNWDLIITFNVKNEEKWLKRIDYDLFYEIEIDVLEAILGTSKEINIPILWKRKIEIKAWTSFWEILEISWDWVKYINSDKKWNLYIKINIKIPKKLTKKEKELYFALAKEKKLNVNNEKWIFEKIFW